MNERRTLADHSFKRTWPLLLFFSLYTQCAAPDRTPPTCRRLVWQVWSARRVVFCAREFQSTLSDWWKQLHVTQLKLYLFCSLQTFVCCIRRRRVECREDNYFTEETTFKLIGLELFVTCVLAEVISSVRRGIYVLVNKIMQFDEHIIKTFGLTFFTSFCLKILGKFPLSDLHFSCAWLSPQTHISEECNSNSWVQSAVKILRLPCAKSKRGSRIPTTSRQ